VRIKPDISCGTGISHFINILRFRRPGTGFQHFLRRDSRSGTGKIGWEEGYFLSRKCQNPIRNQGVGLIVALLRCLIPNRETPPGTITPFCAETTPGGINPGKQEVFITPAIAPGTHQFCTFLHILDIGCAEVSPLFGNRSDGGKVDHSVQPSSTIGETEGYPSSIRSSHLILRENRSNFAHPSPSNCHTLRVLRTMRASHPWVIPYLSPGTPHLPADHHEQQDVRDRGA